MRWSLFASPILISAMLFSWTTSLQPRPKVTDADQKAVIQAIEDEIYDYGYQVYGFDYVGKPAGKNAWEVRVYIQPTLEQGRNLGKIGKGLGYVIYKYMPFGEVLRMFWFAKNGLVILGGNPEMRFSPEHPNYLTIYMGDDELCRDKQTWLKTNFVIELHPSAERLREAEERQKKCVGYSVRLDPSRRLFPPGHDPRCPVN